MADLLLDLIEYLQEEGLVTGDGIDAFRDHMPDSPDRLIAIQEYPGAGSSTGVDTTRRSLQVSVRSDSDNPSWAKEKCWEIYNLLDTPLDQVHDLREHITMISDRWMVISPRQTPFKSSIDNNARVIYSFNMGVTTYRD